MAKRPTQDDPNPKAPDSAPPAGDPDADLLSGGPADPARPPAAEPSDQPKLARVKIGAQEFDLSPEVAAAYEAREREFARGITMDRERSAELERLRRSAAPPATPARDAEPDFNTLLFENPTKALELHGQRIEQKLEQRYQTERALDRFWTTFYKDHPDLDGEQVLVNASFGAIYGEIADLPTRKAQEALADHVRGEILRISRKSRGSGTGTPTPTGRAIVEPASGDRPPTPVRDPDADLPKSLADTIRMRRRERMKTRSA